MSWWKTAKAGDKIVCVDDQWVRGSLQWGNSVPFPMNKGCVYTISKIGVQPVDIVSADGSIGRKVAVWILEANHPMRGLGFTPHRFRPVQTKSTDTGMAILKSILNGARVSEDA